jgi:hypothetical protein
LVRAEKARMTAPAPKKKKPLNIIRVFGLYGYAIVSTADSLPHLRVCYPF